MAACSSLLLITCCSDRKFENRDTAVVHFKAYRPEFEAAVTIYRQLGVVSLDLRPTKEQKGTPSDDEEKLLSFARQLSIVRIDSVPHIGRLDQQYVEMELPGHSVARYGLIFVPTGHDDAWNTVISETGTFQSGSVYWRMIPFGERWFHFEYD
jgi:hypothetical protein